MLAKVLQGAKIRYSYVEKVTYAVLMSVIKLRLYFQSHVIMVYLDQCLRRLLKRPEITRRMFSWTVKLSQHTIKYLPRLNVRVQALIDFIAENKML